MRQVPELEAAEIILTCSRGQVVEDCVELLGVAVFESTECAIEHRRVAHAPELRRDPAVACRDGPAERAEREDRDRGDQQEARRDRAWSNGLPGGADGAQRPSAHRHAARETIQVVGQVPRRVEPPTGVLLQALQADRLQVFRDLSVDAGGASRLFVDDSA